MMTTEDFKLQKRIIAEQRAALNEEEKRIEKQFIESNKMFEIGDKVKVARSNGDFEFGFVSNISVGYDRIIYSLKKEKKDGTPSLNNLYVWSSAIIEKI